MHSLIFTDAAPKFRKLANGAKSLLTGLKAHNLSESSDLCRGFQLHVPVFHRTRYADLGDFYFCFDGCNPFQHLYYDVLCECKKP